MVEPIIAIATVLVDLNLAVRYGIAVRIYNAYIIRKYRRILIWWLYRQTTKLSNLLPHQIFWLFGN